jgi:hypothetical protein
MLTTFEELYLLSIHEDKGTVIASAAHGLQFGLAGAILVELAIQGKITITENHRVGLVDTEPLGDEILDEVIETIRTSEKDRKFGYWIDEFSQKPEKFRRRLAERLVQKGLVGQEEDHLVWIVPSPNFPDVEASTKYVIKSHLRSIVLACEAAELRDIALMNLVKACGLSFLVFLRDERKLAARRIHELMVGEAMKNTQAQAIEEIAVALEGMIDED